MKRVIVDYEKLNTDILDLLVEKYPDGYDYSDIISFQNSEGKTISTVEVRTDTTVYLVKISSKLEQTLEDYQEDDAASGNRTQGPQINIIDDDPVLESKARAGLPRGQKYQSNAHLSVNEELGYESDRLNSQVYDAKKNQE